jgi:3-methylcrotonyl-CoA carboxylase alpha subunit
VEVQIFGDNYGHLAHLFERECSVQRRHQKVIEESPSPALTPALRQQMTEAAVRAARACNYRNAGTIEFLVDLAGGPGREHFYFLEMNTRLQVEHAVTEMVTGLDLVRAQILVASGQELPWNAATVSKRGHAIEARVYAEDPVHDFLPQAGRILLYREPCRPGVRVDAGVTEGGDVPVHYDPLLAKVIATGETRDETVARLVCALREYPILGLRTNIPFLIRILEHPRFKAGEIDTGFLEAEHAALVNGEADMPPFVLAALDAHDGSEPGPSSSREIPGQAWDPWQKLTGWR